MENTNVRESTLIVSFLDHDHPAISDNLPGEIPVARAAVLKHILRSMHRMMQSSGTSEGLRTLIDTSLLKSIKKIIEYRGLFGASILPIGLCFFLHVRKYRKLNKEQP